MLMSQFYIPYTLIKTYYVFALASVAQLVGVSSCVLKDGGGFDS